MLFVVERSRLQQMVRLVREDKRPALQGADSPFLRMAAEGSEVSVAGDQMSASFPATVYEPGVVFLRTTLFRQLLDTFHEEAFLTMQVDTQGLRFGNIFLSFEAADMVLFPLVKQAPPHWPAKLPEEEQPKEKHKQGKLFED